MIRFPKKIIERTFKSNNERSLVIKRNIIQSFFIKGLSIIVNLLYVPLLISYLDNERYGIWLTLTSFLTWFHFFDIGLGNGLRNKLTEAIAKRDNEKAKKLISTSYCLMILIFGPLAVCFMICCFFLPWNTILNVHTISRMELSKLAAIVFPFLSIRFIVQLIQPILYANQKSALTSIFPLVSNILGLIIIFLISKTVLPKLLTAAFVLSGLPVITFFIGSIWYFQFNPTYKPSLKSIDFKISKEILTLGARFFVIQIAAVIINSSSSFIIIQLFGPLKVTEYNVAYKYFQVIIMLNAILMIPLWSAFTEALTKNDFSWIKTTFRKMHFISIAQSIIVIFMLLFSKYLIGIWVGSKVEVSFVLSLALSIYMIQYLFLSPYSAFINGSGKLKVVTYFTVFEALTFIALALIFGKSSLGVAGVVFASCCVKALAMALEIYQTNLIINQKAYGIWNK